MTERKLITFLYSFTFTTHEDLNGGYIFNK